MTLNITVAARWLVVQSSDFRLTRPGRVEPDNTAAQKQVVLQYLGWSGLLCYTGVAQYKSHDTAQWLGNVLAHEAGQRTPIQVINVVAEKANDWLRKVPTEYRRHTFTFVTHEGKTAHIYLISTYEQLGHGPLSAPASPLLVTHARVRGTTCVVTGWPDAVTPRQRADLMQLLAANPAPLDMRLAVARASRESSKRAAGQVSQECVVAHLLPDGTGGAAVFGRVKDRYAPAVISSGVNHGSLTDKALQNAGSGGRSLMGLDWKSQKDRERSAIAMYWRGLSTHTGDGWPPNDPQPGGIELKLVDEGDQ